jgi:hypothetical protein
MPYRYEIDPAARRVIVVGEGDGDFASSVAFMRTLTADAAYRPEFDLLADLRGLEYTASSTEVQGFRRTFDELRTLFRGRIAVVVSGLVRYGIARMLSQTVESSGVRMEAFRDVDAARAWLDEGRG